jgi:putative peptidoglycan lipid II flippase
MFSKVSKLHHENDSRGIFGHIDSSTILLCITLIPATIILCSMGDMLIRILYERGVFTQQATLITNRALFGYSIGLLFYALSLSFVRIFNALHDMKTPAIVGITSIALNVILAYTLMRPLHNLGISLATSIVSFYNFMVLYIIFKRKTHYRMTKNSIYEVIRSLFAGIILLLSIFIVRYAFPYGPYIMVSIGLVLTLIIYGLFFKNYYLSLIRKRL